MMIQKALKLVAIIAILSLFTCIKNIRDFDPNAVEDNEGIVIGKVNVMYNGKHFNENCIVAFSGGVYKLDKTGLVAIPLEAGEVRMARITCQDVSSYKYDFGEGMTFENFGDGKITYFGDVTLEWETKGGFKSSTCLLLFGALGGAILGTVASINDGDMEVKVGNNLSGTLQEYRNATGENPGNVQTSLMSTGM